MLCRRTQARALERGTRVRSGARNAIVESCVINPMFTAHYKSLNEQYVKDPKLYRLYQNLHSVTAELINAICYEEDMIRYGTDNNSINNELKEAM